MIRQFISAAVALAVALCAHAASFDIDCAVDGAHVSAPSSLAVGDTIAVRAPGGASFALRLVSAPPAGVAGQSYIARDDGGSASAVVKLSAGGLRVSIDDFANRRAITVLVKDLLDPEEKAEEPEEAEADAPEVEEEADQAF